MGIFISKGSSGWEIKLGSHTPGMTQISASYNFKNPQTVNITGSVPLDCTIEADEAHINVASDGHRVTIIGHGNTVTINGSLVELRIDGMQNQLSGRGQGIILYTDDEVNENATVIVKKEGYDSAGGPPILRLLNNDPQDNNNNNNAQLETIRIAYRARDGSNSTAPQDGFSSEEGNKGVKREADNSEDEDNDPERKRSRTS